MMKTAMLAMLVKLMTMMITAVIRCTLWSAEGNVKVAVLPVFFCVRKFLNDEDGDVAHVGEVGDDDDDDDLSFINSSHLCCPHHNKGSTY